MKIRVFRWFWAISLFIIDFSGFFVVFWKKTVFLLIKHKITVEYCRFQPFSSTFFRNFVKFRNFSQKLAKIRFFWRCSRFCACFELEVCYKALFGEYSQKNSSKLQQNRCWRWILWIFRFSAISDDAPAIRLISVDFLQE